MRPVSGEDGDRNGWDSGLWHHEQRIGQPWKNTVVRIPGPSCTQVRWMLRTESRAGSGVTSARLASAAE